jgi:SAM-dependent methyltransferase
VPPQLVTSPSTATSQVDGPFTLPPGAEYFVVLQRPAYGWPPARRIPRLGRRFYERHALRHVERRRRGAIAAQLRQGALDDLASLEPHLPDSCESILDIGCGLAGIDLLLHRRYRGATVSLLDREGVSDNLYYGFQSEAAHYASLGAARSFLEANGVPSDAIRTFDADSDGYPAESSFDLIVSLISWGFHYPLETYLADVERTLAPGGTLIVDVRQDTGAEDALARLGPVTLVESSRVRRRLCVVRN